MGRVLVAAVITIAMSIATAAVGAAGGPGAGVAAVAPVGAAKPVIKKKPIPFPPRRKSEMAAYSKRHYGDNTYLLSSPRVIVEHYAVAGSLSSIFNAFAPDRPDPELHELPNVCSHFAVGATGKIWQLVPLNIRCRHTVGLNYTAIGIEHAGFSDADILNRPAQLKASLRLTHYLQCRFGIAASNIIGHNESLSSPFHKELVPALQNQTHGDWKHADMEIYRRKLAARGAC
ncbi:MAG: N-acetylmuramoyl-L-alanine amidase [Solirubrobacterales bacterium]